MAWGATVALEIAVELRKAQYPEGLLFSLPAYMLAVAVMGFVCAVVGNWQNGRLAFWLNVCALGWANSLWLIVAVNPGHVALGRGLAPVALYGIGALLTAIGQAAASRYPASELFRAEAPHPFAERDGRSPE